MSTTILDSCLGSRPRDQEDVWQRYGAFLRRPPLLVVEWSDAETPARGWLVINSLRGGAAGGGTRMRSGLTRREVVYLAKTMELKFQFSGPGIGGAKSGIDFDPSDPRRDGVLRRWFHAIAPYLHHCYGTGGDLNVDEVQDVIPCCAEVGLSHPQEGIVRGHFHSDPGLVRRILTALDHGVSAPVLGAAGVGGMALPLADLVTGYGLAQAILRFHERRGEPVDGLRVLLEGFGAVGGPCALYLARAGARIVGIADRDKVLVAPEGLGADEVEDLLRRRAGKCLPNGDARCLYGAERERFWRVEADLFVSAAASNTLDTGALDRLAAQGVRMIACGANQPFREAKLGATRVQRRADEQFTVLPDVVANCGMARAFSHLMHDPDAADPAAIFSAVDATITTAVHEIARRSGGAPTGVLAATLGYALDRVVAV